MLSIKGLNQYYGGSHILRDITLEVPQQGVTVLLGRNGVGKTTLLRTIMGVVPLRTGSIELDGKPIDRLNPSQRAKLGIGYVPQGREIFSRLTVEENIRMGMATRPGNEPLPQDLLDLFPILRTMLKRRGGDLSGGQQQQLAIARALAMRPRLLILDEPTEGIQPSIIKDIGAVIRDLSVSGKMAILLVEQYYDFAEQLADSYAVMARGAVIRQGKGSAMHADGIRQLVAI